MWRHSNCVTATGTSARTLRVTYTLRVALLVATLLVLAAVAAVQVLAQSGTPAYTVSELPGTGALDDQFRFATAINDAGQVAGTAHIFGDDQVVVWDHGTLIRIGGFTDGRAADINGRGQVVWNNQNGGRTRAQLWEGGVATQLDSLGPTNFANAINDAGQIVGCSLVTLSVGGDCSTAVMWSGGAIIRLGTSGFQRDGDQQPWANHRRCVPLGQRCDDRIAGAQLGQ